MWLKVKIEQLEEVICSNDLTTDPAALLLVEMSVTRVFV